MLSERKFIAREKENSQRWSYSFDLFTWNSNNGISWKELRREQYKLKKENKKIIQEFKNISFCYGNYSFISKFAIIMILTWTKDVLQKQAQSTIDREVCVRQMHRALHAELLWQLPEETWLVSIATCNETLNNYTRSSKSLQMLMLCQATFAVNDSNRL